MIDLHLHLDGSLSEQDFITLAKKENIDLGEEFPKNIYVPMDCPSLDAYLERFDLPLKLLQSKENIKFVTKSLINRLISLNLIYAEIRYAPLLHLQQGLTQLDAAMAANEGVEEVLKEHPDFNCNLILCCMRHAPEEVNMETIEVANKMKGTHVVAVDLAGGETIHPSTYYSKVFNKAKEYGLNITIHAGEATGSEEILLAKNNGAMRIGHGVHLSLDKETISEVKEANLCFEICPTSNLQTKSLKTYNDVPIREFMKNGIDYCINSDNMTVSNTNVNLEYKHMVETFNLSEEEVKYALNNAVNHAFVSEKEKGALRTKLLNNIHNFYLSLKQ